MEGKGKARTVFLPSARYAHRPRIPTGWTHSRSLARPLRALAFGQFLSPLPQRLKSNPSARGWWFAPDRRGAPNLGNRPNKFTNSEGVASSSTANYAEYAKIKTGLPFVYLAYFAVCLPPPQLLQSCFDFARSPSVIALLQRWAE